MSEDTSPDWAVIADAYARGPLTVAQICAKFGISRGALYRQVRRLNWPMRQQPVTSRRRRPVRRQRGGRGAASPQEGRSGMVSRLYEALEQRMTELEARMAQGRRTAAECERDARTLNTLVRLFERLSNMEAKVRAGAGEADPASAQLLGQDAEQIRRDLARRLDRLRAGGQA